MEQFSKKATKKALLSRLFPVDLDDLYMNLEGKTIIPNDRAILEI